MIKKLIIIVLVSIFIVPFSSEFVHAQGRYYPKVENLQGKEQLIKELDELKRIRGNMSTINITADLSKEGLSRVNQSINLYLTELNSVRKDLERLKHKELELLKSLKKYLI